MIHAEYIAHMHDDLAVANIARVSFNKWKSVQDATDERLIKFLAREQHVLPFRHPHITMRCQAPLFIARQLGKHQVGMEWSEVSRRYVDTQFEFWLPEELRERPQGGIKQGSGGIHVDSEELVAEMDKWNDVALAYYERLIARGVAPEQARMVLPQNMIVTWIWTGSLLAFHHMYRLRAEGHAQQEAQDFANAVYDIIEPLYPLSWAALTEERTNMISYLVMRQDDGTAATLFFRDPEAFMEYANLATALKVRLDSGSFVVNGDIQGIEFTTMMDVEEKLKE